VLKNLYLRAKLAVLLGAAFLNPPLFANNQRSNPSTAPTKSTLPPCQLVFDKCFARGTYTTTYRSPMAGSDYSVKYVFYGEWKKDRPHGFGWLDKILDVKSDVPTTRTVGYFKNGKPQRTVEYQYSSPLYSKTEVKSDDFHFHRKKKISTFTEPNKNELFPYVRPSDKNLLSELDVLLVGGGLDPVSGVDVACVKNFIDVDALKVHSEIFSEIGPDLILYKYIILKFKDYLKKTYGDKPILFYDDNPPVECTRKRDTKSWSENGLIKNKMVGGYNEYYLVLQAQLSARGYYQSKDRNRTPTASFEYEKQKTVFAKIVNERASYKALAQPLTSELLTAGNAYKVLMRSDYGQTGANRLRAYNVCTTLPMNELAAVAAEPRYRYSGYRVLSEDQSTLPSEFQQSGQFFQNRLLGETPQNVSYDWAVNYFTDAAADKQRCEVFFDTIQVTNALKDRLHTDGVVLKEGAAFAGDALSDVFTTHLNNSGIDVSGFAEYDFRYRFSPDNWRKFSSYDIRTKQTYDVFLQEMTQASYVGPANEETLLSYLSDKLAASKLAGLTATSIQQQRFALAEEQRAQARRAKEAEDLRRRLAREKSVRDQQARARKIAADQKQLAITHPRSIVIRCLIRGSKFNLLVCLDKTSVEIRANGRYYFGANDDLSAFNNFITAAYPFHAEIVMPVRGSFSLVAQNGSDSAILNVSVIDTATRRTLYEKSVAQYGVVRF
jgi:hypothetical protein